MSEKFSLLLVGLVLSVTLVQQATPKNIDKEFHRQFAANNDTEIHLFYGDANVQIIPWEKQVVDVKVEYLAEVNMLLPGTDFDFEVEFRTSGNSIYIMGREKYSGMLRIYSFRRSKYEYVIRAPRNLTLDLEGEDGEVTIKDWTGVIQCTMEDGEIRLHRIRSPEIRLLSEDGNIWLEESEGSLRIQGEDGNARLNDCRISEGRIRLGDGSIELRNCSGSYTLRTVDGEIRGTNLLTSRLQAQTTDGSMELQLVSPADPEITLQTSDGDVNLELADGTSAQFTIYTDDGHINISSPLEEVHHQSSHRVAGKIGTGKGRIRIITSDGNIALRVAE